MAATRSLAPEPKIALARWALAVVLTVALSLHLWGIRRDLPFTPDVDEPVFVRSAIAMVATGDPNPHWFEHPGSTVFYPLAALYGTWSFFKHQGRVGEPGADIRAEFNSNPGPFYLVGRLLSIAYAVLSLPLVYAIGRRLFDARVAWVATWLAALHPVAVTHAQMVRTDSGGTFFTLLGLWLCLRLHERSVLRNHVLAGAAIGLGIATRYFMVLSVLFIVAVDALLLRREGRKASWGIAAGLVTIPLAFAISTPFFFLDLPGAMESLRTVAEVTHPGADGLTPIGNFAWYLTNAIPNAMTWPQALFVVFGLALALRARHMPSLLLFGFVLAYIAAISTSYLHWQRWIIQVLPLCALVAAKGVVELADRIGARLRKPSPIVLTVGFTVLLVAWPLYDIVLTDIRASRPSTRVAAREWILQNLPADARVAQEWYTAPLAGAPFAVTERFSLAEKGNVEAYASEGYRYAVVSSDVYARFFAESTRYPAQIAFYSDLFARGHLLQEWRPSLTQGGPVIRIYDLSGN